MRTRLIQVESDYDRNSLFGQGNGYTAQYTYACGCGKGKVQEKYVNTPKAQEHTVVMECLECQETYHLDTSRGLWYWDLVQK